MLSQGHTAESLSSSIPGSVKLLSPQSVAILYFCMGLLYTKCKAPVSPSTVLYTQGPRAGESQQVLKLSSLHIQVSRNADL